MRYAIGIDLGGTQRQGRGVTRAGEVLGPRRLRDPRRAGPGGWAARIRAAVRGSGRPARRAAQLDRRGDARPARRRRARRSPFMQGRLAGARGPRLGERCSSTPATGPRAQRRAGRAPRRGLDRAPPRAAANAVLLTLGTGVGGAILSDGRLLGGHLGRAGHCRPHVSLDPDGPPAHHEHVPGTLEDASSATAPCRAAPADASRTPRALVAAHLAGDPPRPRRLAALGPSPRLRHRVDRQRRRSRRWSSWAAASPGPGRALFEPLRASTSTRVEWRPLGQRVRVRARGPRASWRAPRRGARGARTWAAMTTSPASSTWQAPRPGRGRRGAARGHRAGRGLVRRDRSSPGAWSTSSAPATAGSWSRRCGRATARSPASTRSSSCRSPSTTSWSAPTASGRRCSSRTSPASPSASCATSTCRAEDSALVVSSSGCNVVPIEMAEGFRARGIKVVAIVSRAALRGHAHAAPARAEAQDCRRPRARHRRPRRRRDGAASPGSRRRSRPARRSAAACS